MMSRLVIELVMSCDEHFLPQLEVAVLSLESHLDEQYVVRLHLLSNMSDGQLATTVARLPERVELVHHAVDDRSLRHFRPMILEDRESFATYYRLLIPEVLAEFDRVLYLDADIIVTGDLGPLWECGFAEGRCLRAAPDRMLRLRTHFSDELLATLGLSGDDIYFNAGVLLMDLRRWREWRLSDKIRSAGRLIPYALYWDQDLINLALHTYIDPLSMATWNSPMGYFFRTEEGPQGLRIKQTVLQPRIVHFVGMPKPWEVGAIPTDAYRWYAAEARRFGHDVPAPAGLAESKNQLASYAAAELRTFHGLLKLPARNGLTIAQIVRTMAPLMLRSPTMVLSFGTNTARRVMARIRRAFGGDATPLSSSATDDGFDSLYESLGAKCRESSLSVLQVGGPHRSWSTLFPHVRDVHVRRVEQEDSAAMRSVFAEREHFDLIVDASGSDAAGQRENFEILWERVTAQGLYVVEDVRARELIDDAAFLASFGLAYRDLTVQLQGRVVFLKKRIPYASPRTSTVERA